MDNRSLWLRIFTSRKVLIGLAAVATNLLIVLGLDQAKWAPLLTAISSLAGIVIAGMAYEDGKQKSAPLTNGPIMQTVVEAPPKPPGPTPGVNAWPLLLILPAALLAGGCQALTESPAAGYVSADRATYTAVGPEYATYVASDPNMTSDQKARRGRTLATWRLRISRAEEGASTATAAAGPAAPTPSLYQPLPARPAGGSAVPPALAPAPVVPPAAYVVAPPDAAEVPAPQALDLQPAEVPSRLR